LSRNDTKDLLWQEADIINSCRLSHSLYRWWLNRV